MKILAIGAHPDDVEIGVGGFLLKSSRLGREVYILILTQGEVGAKSERRREEAEQSAKRIGVKRLWFGEYRDTELSPNGKLVNSIEEIIRFVNPDTIVTHSVRDEHHDHRAAGICTIEAARYCGRIFAYENPLTKDFIPQVYVDISEFIDEKVELLKIYASQKDKEYLKANAIFGLAQYRALQSRLEHVRFAEALQVVKCSGCPCIID